MPLANTVWLVRFANPTTYGRISSLTAPRSNHLQSLKVRYHYDELEDVCRQDHNEPHAGVEFYVATAIKAKQQQQQQFTSSIPPSSSHTVPSSSAFVAAEAFIVWKFRDELAAYVSELYGLDGPIKFKAILR